MMMFRIVLASMAILAQVAPVHVVTSPTPVPSRTLLVIDPDDDSVLPFTSETPLGHATGLVVDSLAIMNVAGMTIGPAPIAGFSWPSTVDGHLCGWVFQNVDGLPPQMIEVPVPAGVGASLGLALEHYSANKEAAGETLHNCIGS